MAIPDFDQDREIELFDFWTLECRAGRTPDVEALVLKLPPERRVPFLRLLQTTALFRGLGAELRANVRAALERCAPAQPIIVEQP